MTEHVVFAHVREDDVKTMQGMKMNVDAVKAHCGQYPGASSKLFAAPSNVLAYTVGDKQFAYFKTSEPEKWRFSIRTSPDRFLELTDVAGIKRALYGPVPLGYDRRRPHDAGRLSAGANHVVLHKGARQPDKAAASCSCRGAASQSVTRKGWGVPPPPILTGRASVRR